MNNLSDKDMLIILFFLGALSTIVSILLGIFISRQELSIDEENQIIEEMKREKNDTE
jgi:hypothetical protein